MISPDGAPIMMLADHPTTGGYPVIAVVYPTHLGAAYDALRNAAEEIETLIKDWAGTPEPGVGEGFKAHLLSQDPYVTR